MKKGGRRPGRRPPSKFVPPIIINEWHPPPFDAKMEKVKFMLKIMPEVAHLPEAGEDNIDHIPKEDAELDTKIYPW